MGRLPKKPLTLPANATPWQRAIHAFLREHPEISVLRRSEEHTSELQSPDHLVCRLLLEKKNTLPSPSLVETNAKGRLMSLYEPVHCHARDLHRKSIVNPIASFLSCEMLLSDSFKLAESR